MTSFQHGTYKHLTTGTTLVSKGPCTLVRVVINKALTGTVTLSDGTNGVIAVLTNGTTAPFGHVDFMVECSQQLQVALSATEDITVVTG